MKTPFVDLKIQYHSIREEIDSAIHSVIDETAFVRGKYVKKFEQEYAAAYGVKNCVSVANGTDAIYIALKALGVGPGDEVITVANSWISTSEVITQAGARAVFADIEPDYYTIDPAQVRAKVTDRTRAVIPVHLYGQPAEMDAIEDLCRERGLHLIEDCAQAHFAEYRRRDGGSSRKAGTMGRVGTFSFYPGKNLGAYGDAGAIVTDDAALASRMTMYANHGSLVKHQHEIEGINSRLDGLQAAILSVKLKHIVDWNRRRHAIALVYNGLLAGVGDLTLPKIRPNATHVFHLYVIRTRHRDALRKHLGEKGIETGIHYPVALPFLKAYAYLEHQPRDFPVAHRFQGEILSLPMFPELTREQIEYVCAEIRGFFSRV
jgi:dTDP-4-amino-4,6-dideoxygalactose transaminase